MTPVFPVRPFFGSFSAKASLRSGSSSAFIVLGIAEPRPGTRLLVALSLIALVIGSAGARSDEPPGTPADAALGQWAKCAAEAAFALADQPKPARAVVDAAFGSCGEYEMAFRRVVQPFQPEVVDKFKSETMVPDLLVRVMVFRAALQKLRNAPEGPPGYWRM
jgi:hypothetical protein